MGPAAGDGTRKTACVPCGYGYVASALVKLLLEKGYAVKTTLRNPDDVVKNKHLKDLEALGPLEVFRADLDEEGSFDDAVAGCDYVFFDAPPVNLHAENPEKDVIEPAVHGLLNVMRSCVRAGTVKHVVLTSSAAAVSTLPQEGDGHVLDEESWADVEFLTSGKSHAWGFPVSKVRLEKAASAFALENGISLVTVCPGLMVGAAPAAKVHPSVLDVLSLLSGDEARVRTLKFIVRMSGSIPLVHVDDICRAEIFVAEEEAASGRYICCSLNTTVVELARFLAAKYPQYNVNTDRFCSLLEKPRVCISSAKLLGEGFEYKFKNLDEIYDDIIKYGKDLGILPY
ncbi:anthocyanidin reductase ((2S)-flavan-3-ol-forming)-like [Triticum dicoccoides]|uniref:anthocyanidin reductase ((2S)-flavan-3-ol-forming)-like n=1 Tax=Triticum dicoccoides TaxID=85692 RepID=UPI00188DDCCE|nr:anthocyanidin reductase ((2S)-flavan-3-ol-forming)-like [Triticum dicoccoides]